MGLETFWFFLIAVLWAGYFLLEGFDFGVGMLLPALPRDERERSMMFESIGPVWDGNEVWLVVAGAATFAAFPAWYATMFSGFYLALLLILVLLIVRVVSFEWREKREGARWRGTWAWANTIGSVGAAFVWGVALANLVHGVPLNSSHGFAGDFLDLFSAYTVVAGVAVVVMFAVHGAMYLTLRTEGDFSARASAAARRLSVPAAILGVAHRRLDRRRRPRQQQPGNPPDGDPGRADRDRAGPRRDPDAHRAKRLGVRGDRARRDRVRRDDLHRPVSARARLGSGVRQQPDDLQRRVRRTTRSR